MTQVSPYKYAYASHNDWCLTIVCHKRLDKQHCNIPGIGNPDPASVLVEKTNHASVVSLVRRVARG